MAVLVELTKVVDAVLAKLLVDECKAYLPGMRNRLLNYAVSTGCPLNFAIVTLPSGKLI